MPTYCYSNLKGGRVVEKFYRMGKAPKSIRTEFYELLFRDIAAEHSGQKSGDPWTNHWSLSLGARTDEHAKEIGEKCKAAGVSCQFDGLLRIKVDSARHQKQLAKAIFPGQNVRNLDSYD